MLNNPEFIAFHSRKGPKTLFWAMFDGLSINEAREINSTVRSRLLIPMENLLGVKRLETVLITGGDREWSIYVRVYSAYWRIDLTSTSRFLHNMKFGPAPGPMPFGQPSRQQLKWDWYPTAFRETHEYTIIGHEVIYRLSDCSQLCATLELLTARESLCRVKAKRRL